MIQAAVKDQRLWAVTPYFNPMKYERRLMNFRAYRRNLGIPLLVVELSRNGTFQLNHDDADIVLHLTGEDRIWQKESLINFGIRKLPDDADLVAWLDSDLIFANPTWHVETENLLRGDAALVQPFETITHLGRDVDTANIDAQTAGDQEALFHEIAFAKAFRDGFHYSHDSYMSRADLEEGSTESKTRSTPAVGFAFAGRRRMMQSLGLYDATIIGGGDGNLAFASVGWIETSPHGINSVRQEAHYKSWANKIWSAVGARIDHANGEVFHLWHGRYRNRLYLERFDLLRKHGFDPDTDLTRSHNGTWIWADPDSALASEVEKYFRGRKEDG